MSQIATGFTYTKSVSYCVSLSVTEKEVNLNDWKAAWVADASMINHYYLGKNVIQLVWQFFFLSLTIFFVKLRKWQEYSWLLTKIFLSSPSLKKCSDKKDQQMTIYLSNPNLSVRDSCSLLWEQVTTEVKLKVFSVCLVSLWSMYEGVKLKVKIWWLFEYWMWYFRLL